MTNGRRHAVAVGTVVLGIALVPGVASAYRTAAELADFAGAERVVWATPQIDYWVHPSAEGPGLEDVQSALRSASAAWSVSCSEIRISAAGSTTVAPTPSDHRNTVGWVGEDWRSLGLSGDVAATTDIQYLRGADGVWRIVEADILFNDLDFAWSTSAATGGASRDVEAVAIHELGHLTGLLHVCEDDGRDGAPACASDAAFDDAVMYPFYRGTDARVLGADDAAGICHLYPSSGCAFDSDCVDGGSCVSGACVPACQSDGCPLGFECGALGCTPCAFCDDVEQPCAPGCSPAVPGRDLGRTCAADADCTSRICLARGYCATACGEGASCPTGWSCAPDGELCQPAGGAFGDACELPMDCFSRLCLEQSGVATCTQSCDSSDECPAGRVCDVVESVGVCVATPAPPGCAVVHGARPPRGGTTAFVIVLGSLALAVRARENRRRRRGV